MSIDLGLAVTVMDVVGNPYAQVNRCIAPGHFKHQVINHWIVIKTLIDKAQARESATVRIATRRHQTIVISIQCPTKVNSTSKAVYITPHPWLAIESLSLIPHGG